MGVRQDHVQHIHGIVMYVSYSEYVLSQQMGFTVETVADDYLEVKLCLNIIYIFFYLLKYCMTRSVCMLSFD